jgi:predicted RNase H-like nuclease
VRVVGVDLAWGARNPTGLCVVETDRVIDSTTAHSDDEIALWIERHAAESLMVAFDAPLIVRNPPKTCRGPVRVIASLWGGAQASCHPANLGRPWFRDGGRAQRLARRLGLVTDPAAVVADACRVALEVYPHTALVSLFGLPVTLKYKAGRRRVDGTHRTRTVDERREEFGRLLNCLLALGDETPALHVRTSPAWTDLVTRVAQAKTGPDLDRVEDELDAYVCAYIGLHYRAHYRSGDSVVIGDRSHGYIVTPVDDARRRRLRATADAYGVQIS